MEAIGKLIIILGFLLIGVGLILVFIEKIPYIGKLPGDIFIQKKNFIFYFPLTTSIIISIVVSLLIWLWSRR
ncbi:MAG: DUF2905 domain-containing protein [Candidatus Omnitrophica bacterium]|nr:DUF2905 domain-containing protein [Candidatus Omnitrophota bacterium]